MTERRYLQHWTPLQVSRMLSNPFYCGVRVDPHLITVRPEEYNRSLFMTMAIGMVKDLGPEKTLQILIRDLKEASAWTRCIPIHASFLMNRLGIVTEAQFIKAGANQILNAAKTKSLHDATSDYFNLVMDNLEHGSFRIS